MSAGSSSVPSDRRDAAGRRVPLPVRDGVPREVAGLGVARRVGPVLLLLLVLALVGVVSARRILANPWEAGWDEIAYMATAYDDMTLAHSAGWGALRDSMFLHYRFQAPGPRLLAVPVWMAGLMDQVSLRLLGLVLWGVGVLIVFDVTRRLPGVGAWPAAAAAALVAVGPAMLLASQTYGAETTVLPATALFLWALAREAARPMPGLWSPVLLGAALGLGLLARVSFLSLAGMGILALGLAALLLAQSPEERRERLWRIGLVLGVAALLAWPHYAFNLVRYAGYARFALTWPLTQLPADGTAEFLTLWATMQWREVFGVLATIGVLAGLAGAGFALLRLALAGSRLRGLRAAAAAAPDAAVLLGTCAVYVAFTFFAHLTSNNQNPRYVVTALPTLVPVLAVGFAAWPVLRVPAGGLALAQAVLLAGVALQPPGRLVPSLLYEPRASRPLLNELAWLAHRENLVCNWQPLLDLAARLGRPAPAIVPFGLSDGFNHHHVEMAFFAHGLRPRVVPNRNDTVHAPPGAAELDEAARADIVLVLSPPLRRSDVEWTFVPSPNRFIEQTAAAFAGDRRFDALGLLDPEAPPGCRMLAFVPHRAGS
jgi:hypothetical protein